MDELKKIARTASYYFIDFCIFLCCLHCIGSSNVALLHGAQQQVQSQETIDLNLNNVSLTNTLQLLANRLGKNLLLAPSVKDTKVNMHFTNITPEDAFKAILEASMLGYKELGGNVLYVADRENLGQLTAVRNIRCKYADAEAMKEILKTMITSKTGAVMADKRTNTLIIKERPDVVADMERLIKSLDGPTQQIYIQAEIVEVSTTDGNELGVEWLWKTANVKSIKGQIGTSFDLQQQEEEGQEEAEPTQEDTFPFPVGSGLGVGILNTNVTAVLHALSQNNNLNLLSRPRVVTIDNQEATIEVGDQIPFKKLNEFGVTSFEFKDATVQLRVKPHIINSEYIMLDVSPKADFQNGFTPDGTPIISTRKATTVVKIKNGQTIVIGGLIRDSIIQSQTKVPILGDIPLLGLLFKNKKTSKAKTELIVFITPTIIIDSETETLFKKDFDLIDKMQKSME